MTRKVALALDPARPAHSLFPALASEGQHIGKTNQMKAQTLVAAHPAGALNAAAEAAGDAFTPAGRDDSRRQGSNSLLAILYLILFSSMALALYAQTRAL
jgi:hypothetical protein